MDRLSVELPSQAGQAYNILIERGLIDRLGQYLLPLLPSPGARLAVVCDGQVAPLYAHRVQAALTRAGVASCCITIAAGEGSKSLDTLGTLYQACAAQGLTRTDAIMALGGGVVGDVAGLAAATMLRGISLVQVPTTLLAQVDSSVGGKVAINLPAGKNLVGAFHQPRIVLIDPDCLDTLPDRVVADGMAEVIKYGAIRSLALLEQLEAHPDRASLRPLLPEIIRNCCAIKRDLVVADERDTGERQLLNFGHTIGHAYERAHGYHTYTHGEAVAAGMCAITAYSERLQLTPPGVRDRIARLCAAWNLPTHIPCSPDDLRAAIDLDKKNSGTDISLILLHQVGQASIHTISRSLFLQEIAS